MDPVTEPVPVFPTCHYVVPQHFARTLVGMPRHTSRDHPAELQATMDANASVYRTEETLKLALHDVHT